MFNCLEEWKSKNTRLEAFGSLERYKGRTAKDILGLLRLTKPGYEARVLGRIVKGMCEFSDWRDQSDWVLTGGRLGRRVEHLTWRLPDGKSVDMQP